MTPPTPGNSLSTATESSPSRHNLLGRVIGPFLSLGLVILVFAAADHLQNYRKKLNDPESRSTPEFFTQSNFKRVTSQTVTVAVAALGMTVIVVAGGIDLSAGTALALCATVLAWLLKQNVSPPLAVLLTILTGCFTGLINGSLISLLRVVPFIITLGTMTIYLGVAKIVASETTVSPKPAQVPAWIANLNKTFDDTLYLGLPASAWLTLLLAGVLSAVLQRTVIGRHVYAIGSNEATARLCGINIAWNKIAVYTLAGFFVGIGGIFQFSRLSQGTPTSGSGLELRIIAAVVIGGASLSGGRGTVLGTLNGAAIIFAITSGCTQLGVTNSAQDIIIGVIIIAAAAFDQLRQRRL